MFIRPITVNKNGKCHGVRLSAAGKAHQGLLFDYDEPRWAEADVCEIVTVPADSKIAAMSLVLEIDRNITCKIFFFSFAELI